MSSAENISGFRLITKFGTGVAFKKSVLIRLADKERPGKLRYNSQEIFAFIDKDLKFGWYHDTLVPLGWELFIL